MSWLGSVHPDDRQAVADDIERKSGGDLANAAFPDYRIIRPDGIVRWIRARAFGVLDTNGKLYRIAGIAEDITERKRAEISLFDSEERLRRIIESSPDSIVVKDREGRVGIANRTFFQRYDLTEAQVLGRTAYEFRPKSIADHHFAQDRRVMESGVALREDLAVTFADGREHIIAVTRFPIFDNQEQISSVGSISVDITESKTAEAALRKSEDRLIRAQQIARVGDWSLDLITEELYWSEEVYSIFHVGRETFDGTTESFYRRVHPDDVERVRQITNTAIGSGKSHEFEHRIVLPDGNERTIHERVEVECDQSGMPVFFLGTAQDITDRKRAEDSLRESEERFRVAFENVPVGNIIINDKGIVETFNAAAENIFGYLADEVIGQNIKMLMPVPDRNRHDGYLQNYLRTAEPKVIGIGREVTGLRKNGEEFAMHLSIGEMPVGDGRSFIGSITDLKELKGLEQKLSQAQRMEAVGQLTGGVAHDFNNLMAIMINNAELLKDGVGEDEEARECIEEIIAAVDRGSSLTGRLLAFSRKTTLVPVATDVSDLIGGLHDMLQRTLGEAVEIKVVGTPDVWPARTDPHQFENALVNLAINARDAMPKGGTLTIETANVTLDRTYAEQQDEVAPGDYVTVAVNDSGTGMPPGVLEKVFDPFFTTKEVGKGSGLGLSMVYGFVKQSKGHITIYSEVDLGTTVKLYMPRSQEGAAKTDVEDDALDFARGSERILVVEDDPGVRKGPVKILRGHGYEVAEAGNGEEAIDHLKTGRSFDLLFTDVILPGGMNGVEIGEEAKRLQPDIKVLYTTGYAKNAVAHHGRLDSGKTLVNKPYRRAELLEMVRAVLDREDD